MPDDITLHTSCQKQVTCISNSFIDHFMPEANGEYVKIYLYLLRCLSQEGMDFSISAMSDALEHTQRDIKRALKHWEKCHLLRLEYDGNHNMVGICLLDPDKAVIEKRERKQEEAPVITGRFALHNETEDTQAPLEKSKENAIPTYSPVEIAAFSEKKDAKEIFYLAESFMGHTLSATEMNAIISWSDALKLPAEVVEYLIEYCVDAGHTSIRYMNKVAINWAEAGIETVEQAKEESSIHSKNYFVVMKAFGISGRQLIKSEQAYAKKWASEYAFSAELIQEACRRTITNTGRANFEYADSILTNWYNAGVHSLDDVLKLDETHIAKRRTSGKAPQQRASYSDFDQRNHDDSYYDNLERILLQQ